MDFTGKLSTNPIIAQVTKIVNYTVMHAVDRALKIHHSRFLPNLNDSRENLPYVWGQTGKYKLADWKDCIERRKMFQRQTPDRKEKEMSVNMLENTAKKKGNKEL